MSGRDCGDHSVFFGIPYRLFPNDSRVPNPWTGVHDDPIQFWIHFGLVIICFILAIVSFIVQIFKAMPYGKQDNGRGSCRVHQRTAFAVSQIVTGIVIFSVTFFLQRNFDGIPNIIMYCLFTIHYINRGIVDTIANRHNQRTVRLWVPVVATISTLLYHFINAQFIGEASYCDTYVTDPRFLLGLIIFITGFILNRVADGQLICLRKGYHDSDYQIPKGCSFFSISCPNYLGEIIEWFGWALMSWSLAGLVWFLFVCATHIPRARHNHKWYQKQFDEYPPRRTALIPFIY